MNTLILTVGLPRCGKSTWAKEQGIVVVNPDSIRLAIHGQRFDKEFENLVWYIAKVMVKSQFEYGEDTIIIDATNTTPFARAQWKSNNWERKYKIFKPNPEICCSRAVDTLQMDIIPIINKMYQQWDISNIAPEDILED